MIRTPCQSYVRANRVLIIIRKSSAIEFGRSQDLTAELVVGET